MRVFQKPLQSLKKEEVKLPSIHVVILHPLPPLGAWGGFFVCPYT
nr:MAG TPA: hypothetical protein [Caudoviricetes sp.]DAW82170.1 MAG TPA: hypothetical protein [Caudoviricetes sp.]